MCAYVCHCRWYCRRKAKVNIQPLPRLWRRAAEGCNFAQSFEYIVLASRYLPPPNAKSDDTNTISPTRIRSIYDLLHPLKVHWWLEWIGFPTRGFIIELGSLFLSVYGCRLVIFRFATNPGGWGLFRQSAPPFSITGVCSVIFFWRRKIRTSWDFRWFLTFWAQIVVGAALMW